MEETMKKQLIAIALLSMAGMQANQATIDALRADYAKCTTPLQRNIWIALAAKKHTTEDISAAIQAPMQAVLPTNSNTEDVASKIAQDMATTIVANAASEAIAEKMSKEIVDTAIKTAVDAKSSKKPLNTRKPSMWNPMNWSRRFIITTAAVVLGCIVGHNLAIDHKG